MIWTRVVSHICAPHVVLPPLPGTWIARFGHGFNTLIPCIECFLCRGQCLSQEFGLVHANVARKDGPTTRAHPRGWVGTCCFSKPFVPLDFTIANTLRYCDSWLTHLITHVTCGGGTVAPTTCVTEIAWNELLGHRDFTGPIPFLCIFESLTRSEYPWIPACVILLLHELLRIGLLLSTD